MDAAPAGILECLSTDYNFSSSLQVITVTDPITVLITHAVDHAPVLVELIARVFVTGIYNDTVGVNGKEFLGGDRSDVEQ